MITVDELNKLMSNMFMSSQLNKIGWNGISDDDKQVVELTVLKRWTFDNERIEFEMEEIK